MGKKVCGCGDYMKAFNVGRGVAFDAFMRHRDEDGACGLFTVATALFVVQMATHLMAQSAIADGEDEKDVYQKITRVISEINQETHEFMGQHGDKIIEEIRTMIAAYERTHISDASLN